MHEQDLEEFDPEVYAEEEGDSETGEPVDPMRKIPEGESGDKDDDEEKDDSEVEM